MSMNAMLIACLLAGAVQDADDHHARIPVAMKSGPFTTMHHGDDVRIPYLWPVIGPGGVEMTRAYPMERGRPGESEDHPHHTSLWFAHGDINGHDFWHSKGNTPRVDVVGKPVVKTSGNSTTIDCTLTWVGKDGEKLLSEARRMTFAENNGVRRIDFDLRLEALVDVVFGDTKEGSFAMRLNPALRLRGDVAKGHAFNSEGATDDALWGKRARWLTYFGTVGEDEVGVAIFDHPENLRYPTWWHARDYGLVGANPFGVHDFEGKPAGTGDHTLPKGEVLHLRYRVLLYAGKPDQTRLQKAWLDWGAPGGQKPPADPNKAAVDPGKADDDS